MRITRRGEQLIALAIIAASIFFVLAAGVIGQRWEAQRCEVQLCQS